MFTQLGEWSGRPPVVSSQSLSLHHRHAIPLEPPLRQLPGQAEDAGEGGAGPPGEDEHEAEAWDSAGENTL